MSTWKLDINGTESTLADLGVERFDFNALNMAEDTLVLHEVAGPLNASPILTYGNTVKLLEDTTIRFIGTVTTSPRAGLPGQIERRSYTVKNIFWDLNRIIYEQDWHEDEDNTYFKGRVKLGKDADENRISVDVALADVLGFAQSEGLLFTYNLPGVAITPPDAEHMDITCFEAIKALLGWAPSAASSVDYSSGTPEINFVRRSGAAVAEFTATALSSLSVTPRDDQQLEGVVIHYEILNQYDGKTFTKVEQDSAGETSGLNVLKQTIDLQGEVASSTELRVEVETSTPPATPGETFFKKYIPGLSKVEDLEITDQEDTATLPRILVSGTVPEWTDMETEEAEFTAKLSGKINDVTFSGQTISAKVTCTDAESKTYTQLASATYTPPEDIPIGLAAQILSDRSQLHYEGSFSTVSATPDFSINTAKVCNILPGGVDAVWGDGGSWSDGDQWLDTAGGFAGLESVRAVIESVRISFDGKAAVTNVSIGPPRHLQAQDFIAIARASRDRVSSSWSRKEQEAGPGGAVNTGGLGPNNNGGLLTAGLPDPSGHSVNEILIITESEGNKTWSITFPKYSA